MFFQVLRISKIGGASLRDNVTNVMHRYKHYIITFLTANLLLFGSTSFKDYFDYKLHYSSLVTEEVLFERIFVKLL